MVETGENSNYFDIESLMSRTFIFVSRNGKLDSAVTRPNGLIIEQKKFVRYDEMGNASLIIPGFDRACVVYTELFDKTHLTLQHR